MYNDWGWEYLDEFICNFEVDKYLKDDFVKPKSKILFVSKDGYVKPKLKTLFVSKLPRAKSKKKKKKFFSRNTTPHNTISLTLDDFFISKISEKHTTKVLPLF